MSSAETRDAYAAEHQLWRVYDIAEKNDNWNYDFYGFKFELPKERKFADLESIERYVTAVLELEPVKAKFPNVVPPKVRARTTGGAAHFDPVHNVIAICPARGQRFAMREIVVLHELAHALAHDEHGAQWRSAFVFLIGKAMGPELAMVLGAIYHQELGTPHASV